MSSAAQASLPRSSGRQHYGICPSFTGCLSHVRHRLISRTANQTSKEKRQTFQVESRETAFAVTPYEPCFSPQRDRSSPQQLSVASDRPNNPLLAEVAEGSTSRLLYSCFQQAISRPGSPVAAGNWRKSYRALREHWKATARGLGDTAPAGNLSEGTPDAHTADTMVTTEEKPSADAAAEEVVDPQLELARKV